MNKSMKSFRLSDLTCEDLAKLASKYGTSQASIIEKLVSISYLVCFDEGMRKNYSK